MSGPVSHLVARADALAALPEVAEAVEQARAACARLRQHPVLRRHAGEAVAEAQLRGARASAVLEGADVTLDQARRLTGAGMSADPVSAVARGVLQATVAASEVSAVAGTAPGQALARLHVAATAHLLPADQVGRPRLQGEAPQDLLDLGEAPVPQTSWLPALTDLVRAPATVPAMLVASLAHAEIAVARPFVLGSGIVGRALERSILQGRGMDPARLCVPEVGHARSGPAAYLAALAAYRTGSSEGLLGWVAWTGAAVVRGAAEGAATGDAVLAEHR